MKKIILQIGFIIFPLFLIAQQDAQYTQYSYNMSIVNPGYTTGDTDIISTGILNRSQWSGIYGAPRTSTIFLRTLINSFVETGISIVNDNVGDIVKENNIFADVAYKLDLEENGYFSFGIKTGVTFFDVNFNNLTLESGEVFTDPNFSENINRTFFNFGFGSFIIPNIFMWEHHFQMY